MSDVFWRKLLACSINPTVFRQTRNLSQYVVSVARREWV